jgi:hypothetical protein
MEGRIDFSGILDGNVFAGSDVEITPTLTSGTKIADYEVDGVAGELYAPSGGGSTVEIEPTLSSGTKIADFEVDGVSGELYAPSGGGSTVEIEPTLSTGTKIADFEVDGVSGNLYAPTPISSYNSLTDKPTINNVTVQGNMTINEVPAFTASDDGKVLGVDNGILSWVESGGGSGGNAIVELARTATFYAANQRITLNDSIDNYDLLLFSMVYQGSPTAVKFFNGVVTVGDFKTATERFYTAYGGAGYNDVKYINDTTIQTLRINGDVRLQAIYGIKLSPGSGSRYISGYGINIANGIISEDHYKTNDTATINERVVPALVYNSKTKMEFTMHLEKPIDFNHISSIGIGYLNVYAYNKATDDTTTINIVTNGTTNAGFSVTLDAGPTHPDSIVVQVSTVDPYPAFNVEDNGTIMLQYVTMTLTF